MIDRTDICTVQLGFCHCCCAAAKLPVLPWRNEVSSGYSNKLRALDNKIRVSVCEMCASCALVS